MQRYEANSNRKKNSGNFETNSRQSFGDDKNNSRYGNYNKDVEEEYEEDERLDEGLDKDDRDKQWSDPISGRYNDDFNKDDSHGFRTKSGRRGFGGKNATDRRELSNSTTGKRNIRSQGGMGGNSQQLGNYGASQGGRKGGSQNRGIGGKNLDSEVNRQDGNNMGERNNPGRDKNANRLKSNRHRGDF